MCVDCVLASLRIAQVDPGNEPLLEVVLSQRLAGALAPAARKGGPIREWGCGTVVAPAVMPVGAPAGTRAPTVHSQEAAATV
jgi:hypothetical protein